jgi:hypothetical protein
MNDQALIQSLCDDLKPAQPHLFERQLTAGLVLGGAVSLVALMATLGIQPGLGRSSGFIPLALKVGYAATLAALALGATVALARPDAPYKSRRIVVASLIALLGAVALVQFVGHPQSQAARLLLGASWQSCSLRIVALALPLIAGIGWAVRKQAPVRPDRAGAAIGLAAGSVSAAIYALACTEASAGFVLIWYSLGIALSAGVGALLGRHLLRW